LLSDDRPAAPGSRAFQTTSCRKGCVVVVVYVVALAGLTLWAGQCAGCW